MQKLFRWTQFVLNVGELKTQTFESNLIWRGLVLRVLNYSVKFCIDLILLLLMQMWAEYLDLLNVGKHLFKFSGCCQPYGS